MASETATPVALSGRIPLETGQGSRWRSPIRSVRFISHFWSGWRNLRTHTRQTDNMSHPHTHSTYRGLMAHSAVSVVRGAPQRAVEVSKLMVYNNRKQ